MKYVGEDEKVRMLIAERHPFKGVENYFFPPLSGLETDENFQPEEPNSGNEANTAEAKEECLWEVNPLIIIVDKLDFDTTANVEGE